MQAVRTGLGIVILLGYAYLLWRFKWWVIGACVVIGVMKGIKEYIQGRG